MSLVIWEEELTSKKQVLNKMMPDFTLKEATALQFIKFYSTAYPKGI